MMAFFGRKDIKILGGFLLFILAGGVVLEILARSLIGFSPFLEPLTALERVGEYKAPDIEVGFYPENLMNDFAVQDGKLYISDFGSHLRVIDASNPANLKEIATLPLDYQAGITAASEDYLFLTKFSDGEAEQIEIFDISSLEKVGEYTPQCESFCLIFDSVVVFDNKLYLPIMERSEGSITKAAIHVLDITDPSSILKYSEISIPREGLSKSSWLNFDGTRNNIGVIYENRFYLFSHENTGNYELASTYVLPQEDRYACRKFTDLTLQENRAYALEQYGESSGCGRATLHIFDISNPISPEELGRFEFSYNAGEVEVKGDYAFVGNRARGMRVLDVSNPSAPKEVAHYTRFATSLYQEIWQMEIGGKYAYVVEHQVLGDLKRIDIVDISALFQPF